MINLIDRSTELENQEISNGKEEDLDISFEDIVDFDKNPNIFGIEDIESPPSVHSKQQLGHYYFD